MKPALSVFIILGLTLIVLSACSPQSPSEHAIDVPPAASEVKLDRFLDEGSGLYFDVPSSWYLYRAVYVEGPDLPYNAEEKIEFFVNDELIVEFWVVKKVATLGEEEEIPTVPQPHLLTETSTHFYLYSVNQEVESQQAQTAVFDFLKIIRDSFGVLGLEDE